MFATLLKRAALALALTTALPAIGSDALAAPAVREEFPTPGGFMAGYAQEEGVNGGPIRKPPQILQKGIFCF